MLSRTIGKTVKLTDASGPARVEIQPVPFDPEEIVSAVQIVALRSGQLYLQAPQAVELTFQLLIEGLCETRKRQGELLAKQQAEQDSLLIAFPKGVTPR